MLKRTALAAIFIVMAALSLMTQGEEEKPLAVVFCSQEQGSLVSCRCPFNPGGGLARRMTVLNSLRSQYRITLVHAGGWMPGGILDEMSGGVIEQTARTGHYASILADTGCDVVAVCEDDLALGREVLETSAARTQAVFLTGNLDLPGKKGILIDTTYFFAVSDPTTASRLYPEYAKLSATNSVEFAKAQVDKAQDAGAKKIVLISQMPEKQTIGLLRKLDGIDLAYIAHREHGSRTPYRIGKTLVAATEPQGRELGVWVTGKGFERIKLDTSVREDEETLAKLQRLGYDKSGLAKVKLDFYFMSRCPYGRPAAIALLDAASKLASGVELGIYFVVSVNDKGELVSLHGVDELEDNRRMLAIWLQKRDALLRYLTDSVRDGFDFGTWLTSVGIDPFRMKASLESGEIDEELKLHARRCDLRGINASPTLTISNIPYSGDFDPTSLMFGICSRLSRADERFPACNDLPECISDGDCSAPGLICICENAGSKDAKCRRFKDAEVKVKVIRSSLHVSDPFDAAKAGMKKLMPSLSYTEVAAGSSEGIRLIEQHKIQWLPAFVFEKSVEKAYRFKAVNSSLVRSEDGSYLANPFAVNANFRADRERKPGVIELFVSPYSEFAGRLLERALELEVDGFDFPRLRFIIRMDKDGKPVAQSGIAEAEECARMCAALKEFPANARDYISSRFANIGSSYWDDDAAKAGIEPNLLKTAARSLPVFNLLKTDAEIITEYFFEGPAFILYENRELIIARDTLDFEVLLCILRNADR